MLKSSFLSITAIGIVAITATAKAGQPLDHLTWDNWGIDIYQVGYTSQVPATVSNKEADEGSLFIRVETSALGIVQETGSRQTTLRSRRSVSPICTQN
jgi:hypothetical protein